ncbi:DUF1643 domain-containing protein [Sideroxydans lithotrophicus]|uniref:DUF1643 domain-containing protein n=1 Tax=Sideroxydans lithotrophicus (strain ES-1) TaxID=580332 RepID=D5CTA3_SIDLE|nr:DUF1643 domain-containing protein [Sideroxydans lithotrophicus]ADE12189.1 protein of unknown function DUF1643 [Sideroxydans lithotrophicus ES-1]
MSLFDQTGAVFSPCKKYRYLLWRDWDVTKLVLTFVMLNPSTADEVTNDPTVEHCQRRAVSGGFGRLQVVNIFALRSTDPQALYSSDDPAGPDNDATILEAVKACGVVICAWGTHGNLNGRGADVLKLLRGAGIQPHYLVLNKDGTPKHPLYVGYDVNPTPWEHP